MGTKRINNYIFFKNTPKSEINIFYFICLIFLALVLKRKAAHAIKNRKYFQNVLDGLLARSNPHNPGNNFTENFFREQWQGQRTYELEQSNNSRAEKEKCAEFYERGEALRLLAYVIYYQLFIALFPWLMFLNLCRSYSDSFLSQLTNPTPGSNQDQVLETYEKLQSLQKEQDVEAEKLGSFFSASYFNTITPRNRECVYLSYYVKWNLKM
jgi:hypothetical protein